MKYQLIKTNKRKKTKNTCKMNGAKHLVVRFLGLLSVRGQVNPRAMMQLEGLCQLKNPATSLGTEPMFFQLVA
jgi:hypothetical protein